MDCKQETEKFYNFLAIRIEGMPSSLLFVNLCLLNIYKNLPPHNFFFTLQKQKLTHSKFKILRQSKLIPTSQI